MFWTRLKSSIVLTAVLVTFMVFGGLPLFLLLGLITFIGMMEFYRVQGIHRTGLAYAAYLVAAVYLTLIYFEEAGWSLACILFGLVVLLAVYVLTFPKFKDSQVIAAFFGLVYVAVMLSFIYQTRELPGGAYLVWLIFLCSWGCDVSAYCVGMLIGKHKLAPVLSPKKSIEGAIGGIAGSALFGVIYALIFRDQMMILGNPVLGVAILCAVGAAISQIGDLAASAIKRNHEIKDYGTLIPGHGGVLDRFDSVIFTAPIVYYLIMLLAQLS